MRPDDGHWGLTPGLAEGRLIGGNLCTLNLLQGTPRMADLSDTVVFVENDLESSVKTFDRELTSLTQQTNVDFGHTDPLLTLPVGGDVTVAANETGPTIRLGD